MNETINTLERMYKRAEGRRSKWESLWRDCYDYALPMREGFDEQTGSSRMDEIFDSTAVTGVPEFASRMVAGLTPPFAQWMELKAGPNVNAREVPQSDKNLQLVTTTFFTSIAASNFDQEFYEAIVDVSIGTGVLLFEQGDDIARPFKFTAVPMNLVYLLPDAYDEAGTVIYTPKGRLLSDLMVLYPQGTYSEELNTAIKESPDKEVKLRIYTYRDWSRRDDEVYNHIVYLPEFKHVLYETEFIGEGSNPWIVFRWNKTSGEVYGRGPLLQALPDIKMANAVKELILRNGEISITGMWQADDDGILNPANITLEAGTIIPKALGSQGLQSLQSGANFDVSQITLEDLRMNIRKALFNEALGRPEGTPMTAMEVAERMADLNRQIGSPAARIYSEGIVKIVRRGLYILKLLGLVELPSVGRREIDIQPISQLAKGHEFEKISQYNSFLGIIQMTHPQAPLLMLNVATMGEELAKLHGINPQTVNSAEEIEQNMQLMMQAQQGAGAPVEG